MKANDLRSVHNPYRQDVAVNRHNFVGRKEWLEKFNSIITEYKTEGSLENVIVCGEKSIGKSTLLSRFESILADHNFYTFMTELQRDGECPINEFEFFKDIFNSIFTKCAPIEGTCLSSAQQEMWFCLTSFEFSHESSFSDRELQFPTMYCNKINGKDIKLSYETLETDFLNIVSALSSGEYSYNGVAILIDEFQELRSNRFIIDTLRKLSQKINNLMIVAVGLENILGDESYQKFCRTGYAKPLEQLSKEETLDLICKPLQDIFNCSRFEIKDCFTRETINELVVRSKGNPMHVKFLCECIFDYFKENTSLEAFVLNRDVMGLVMEKYSAMSTQKKELRNALEACSEKELNILTRVMYLENMNIRSIVKLTLSFDPLNDKLENEVKDKILSDIAEIYGLGLFKFSSKKDPCELQKMTVQELSREYYVFQGDAIDKMYFKYLYEEICRKNLELCDGLTYETMLSHHFLKMLSKEIFTKHIIDECVNYANALISFTPAIESSVNIDKTQEDYSTLKSIKFDKKLNDKDRDTVKSIASKYALDFPAFLASFIDLKGFFCVHADIDVKGVRSIYKYMIPVVSNSVNLSTIEDSVVDYTKYINASTSDYMFSVNWIYIVWLPEDVLMNVFHVCAESLLSDLICKVKERKFENCVEIADEICQHRSRVRSKNLELPVESYNNLAFCRMILNDIDWSHEHFSYLQSHSTVSKINFAFTSFVSGDADAAIKLLKSVLKLQKNDRDIRFINLAVINSDIKLRQLIVEDVKPSQIANWNLALIDAQTNKNITIQNSYMKRVDLSESNKNDQLIHDRVMTWLYFLRGDIARCIQNSKRINNVISSDHYMYNDLKSELAMFESFYHDKISQC